MSQEQENTPVSTNAMIATMLRLQSAKDALEREEEIGRKVMEQVRANIEADLAPHRQEITDCRRSIEAFIRQTGEKFKAPGLGSAYIASRRQTSIVDHEAFAAAAKDMFTEEVYDQDIMPRKLSVSMAKKYAAGVIENTGELMPGVEIEETETLTVRLTGGGQ